MMNENKSNKPTPKILIVDDVETNRYVLRNIITNMGYLPILAENGLQAQKILQKMSVQLILLDVAMPEMDGYEFCAWQKADPQYREIPTIFISAYDNPQDIVEGLAKGGEDYITKPFMAEVVKARVSLQLKLYMANQELQETNRRLNASVQEQLLQIEKEKKNVLYALAEVARENASYEETHAERLKYNCKMLAQAMQLSPHFESEISDNFVDIIGNVAPLCDVGNVTIPIEILQKDEHLNKEERTVMQTHTTAGAKLLAKLQSDGDYNDFMQMSVDIANFHHEKWDGTGYPEGKSGDDIPLAAQIVSIVGTFCSLTEKRVYRPAYSKEEAIEMLNAASGRNFSENIVSVMTKIARQLK